MSTSGNDAKFFTRGKIQEFKAELQEAEKGKDKKFLKRKTVLKKIVANITMGNDMSQMFPEVLQCLSIPLLEIKKMVYLFLVSYGRARPDLIAKAIPQFDADCHDRNPLIRALALRTMSYIPLPAIFHALIDPLRHSLKDNDPYVRKTAAICVAKIYFADPRIVIRERFAEMLQELLKDANPTVVANAVAALMEIQERAEGGPSGIGFTLTFTAANKLVAGIGDCPEWGQIYILESLLNYIPQSSDDATLMTERIVARLQHANSAVVLTVIKVLLYLMNYIESKQSNDYLCKKMGPPLVTLLSSGPEVQYVALRNILLIIQRRPAILRDDVKVFFCKYNDPIYVKLAKLEIMYRLARDSNAKEVLAELYEYATEVDIDFVRKAVRSIGRLAIKVSSAADECIKVLLDLISNKVNYVVQEAIVVIKDIFRRYPDQYEKIIPTLCENLELLDEPEAKAAMIWIVGQYAERIDNADDLMENLCYSFLDESVEVQLALVTACVKLFIQKPNQGKKLVQKVLKSATEEVDNPDLRDRGYMYWRLLASDAGAAKGIVMGERPPVNTDTDRMELGALDQLLLHVGTLGSIYHKTPESFIRHAKGRALPDSPALNASSKRVLIPLVGRREQVAEVSTATLIPPPAPSATSQSDGLDSSSVNAPAAIPNLPPRPVPQTPISPTADGETQPPQLPARQGTTNTTTSVDAETNLLESGPVVAQPQPHDPYADLSAVFGGGYVTDQPKPTTHRGGEFDDLLL